jgi:hypothetical protein
MPHGTTVHPSQNTTQHRRDATTDAQQEGFQRWLASRPNAEPPRFMPANWSVPTYAPPLPPSLVYSMPVPCISLPAVAGACQPVQPVQPVWCSIQPPVATLPVIPANVNVNNWNYMPAGAATYFPWVAHPLPHPSIPAQQFWQQAASMPLTMPWRGPNGLPIDPVVLAQNPYSAYFVTGGHPLPGHNNYWTPADACWPLPADCGQCAPNTSAPPPGHIPGTILLAPWLIPNPRNSLVPHILWDVAIEPPSSIKRLTGRGDIVDFAGTSATECYATYPLVEKVHIQIPNMRPCWGAVSVKKKDGKDGVRVCDVFEGVWKYSRTSL